MNIFREVELRAASKPKKISKVDWGDPVEVAFHLREMRHKERTTILDELVPRRICPSCERIRINSSSWVVNKEKTEAICKSCYRRRIPDKDLDKTSKLDCKLFVEMKIRYRVSAIEISRARAKINISVNEFARQAGWSAAYQYKLEDGSVLTVTSEVAETILEVFLRLGFYTKDVL